MTAKEMNDAFFRAVGLMTSIVIVGYLIYLAVIGVFYDPAFNDGFEAGRASAARSGLCTGSMGDKG